MSALIEIKEERGILIVDDDENLIIALKETLSAHGYCNVFMANNPEKGLSILESNGEKIYTVLLDLKMPSMNGIEFIQHLVNVHRNSVGIIMITGYGSPDVEEAFYKINDELILTESFIEKPIKFEVLREKIDEVSSNIYKKRIGYLNVPAVEFHKKLDIIKSKIARISDQIDTKTELSFIPIGARLDKIEKKLFKLEKMFEFTNISKLNELIEVSKRIDRKQPNFLTSLGLDIVRFILIALAIFSILYLDVGKLFTSVIGK